MTVLDASVVIAHLNANDIHHHHAEALLASVLVRGDGRLSINPLTLAEVLVVPARESELREVEASILDLGIRPTGWPRSSAALAMVRADTGLRFPDAAVLLTAEEHREPLATFDQRLADTARSRGVSVLGA